MSRTREPARRATGARPRTAACLLAAILGAPAGAAAQEAGDAPLPNLEALAPAEPAPGGRWRLLPGIAFGYDTFGQSYSVDSRDTLDLVDEISGRVLTTIERRGRTRFELENRLGVGSQSTREDLWAALDTRSGPLDLRLEHELHAKFYARGADFAEASDYWGGLLRGIARLRLSPDWRLRIEDRLEWTQFETPTTTSYDTRSHDAAASVAREYGLLSRVELGYGFGTRAVPDSNAIDHRRHVARLEWDHGFGGHLLQLGQRLERRSFADPRVRSAYFDYAGELALTFELQPRLRLRPTTGAVIVAHDRADSIYSDSVEQAVELLLEGDATPTTVLALGPRAEFRRTTDSFDRAYNQWGLVGRVTYNLGTTLWLYFRDEVGVRRHLAGDELFFTDYVYNWSSLHLTWQPRRLLELEIFCALDPELHDEDADDTTTILLTASVTVGWK